MPPRQHEAGATEPPRARCRHCGALLEVGHLSGGQGFLFWHAPPYPKNLFGFKRGLELLVDPRRWRKRDIERGTIVARRCRACRWIEFAY